MPNDIEAAFVLVQHMAPDHRSTLAEILTKSTDLPVVEIEDDAPLQPGHVYVGVANRLVEVHKDRLRLVPPTSEAQRFRTLDLFLQSLARNHQQRAVGILLSGTGSDGTLGLQEIKLQGGVTFGQDADSCRYAAMPLNAHRAGHVDLQAPPEEIAAELARIAKDGWMGSDGFDEEDDTELQRIFNLLRRTSQVDFSGYKLATVQRRLNRRRLLRRQENLGDYLRLLQRDPEELQALYNDLLINVTQFFREPEAFESLRTHLEKALGERSDDDAVRVWVPACATGEEAYSLAILLLEVREKLNASWPIKVFGTDLSESSIGRAREGRYDATIAADVSEDQLQRHFVKSDGGHRVRRDVRDMCMFSVHNVIQDPPFSRIDIVSCRNLLIYLRPPEQERVLSSLHYALTGPAVLMLGPSEALGPMREFFEELGRNERIFRRKDHPRPVRTVPMQNPNHVSADSRIQHDATVRAEADSILLRHHSPPAVVVNEAMDILQFRGDTNALLAPASGDASLHLLRMARTGLDIEIRAAWQAKDKANGTVRRACRFFDGDQWHHLDIEVTPLSSTVPRRYLIVFLPKPREAAAPAAGGSDGAEVHRLQEELEDTREHLQAALEATETTNAELRAAHEEALSSNEEMQSTNEELQTTMEELQSTNEELTTVNDELQSRNRDLDRLNDDLENLLQSVGMPIVFVDKQLRIGRFTPQAEKLLRLIASDVGRPVGDVQPRIEFTDLEGAIRKVVHTGEALREEVRSDDGTWYELHITPYRAHSKAIDGAVVVLSDVDQLRRRYEEVALLIDAANAIAESADFDAAVQAVMQIICSSQDWAGAEAWLADGDHLSLRHAWSHQQALQELDAAGRGLRLRLGEGLPGKAWENKRLATMEGIDSNPQFSRHAEARKAGLHSAVAAPIMAGDDVVMVLMLLASGENVGRDRDRAILQVIAQQLGFAFTRRLANDRLNKQAESLQRMNEELDDFARLIAHDISNPTRSARMYLDLLDASKLDVKESAHLERAQRLLEKTEAMIVHLIEFTRGENGADAIQAIRISEMLADVEEALSAHIKRAEATLVRVGDADIRVDATILHHAILNIVDNAIKYRHPERQPRVHIEVRDDADEVSIEISDNGRGMDESALAHAFSMFWQKDPAEGTGMGLAIARRMVERVSGTITAESDAGEGSRFTIRLPKAPEQASSGHKQALDDEGQLR